jgi:hypothetical protein
MVHFDACFTALSVFKPNIQRGDYVIGFPLTLPPVSVSALRKSIPQRNAESLNVRTLSLLKEQFLLCAKGLPPTHSVCSP